MKNVPSEYAEKLVAEFERENDDFYCNLPMSTTLSIARARDALLEYIASLEAIAPPQSSEKPVSLSRENKIPGADFSKALSPKVVGEGFEAAT